MYLTSEAVSSGHPDKVADYISDSILSAYVAEDPESHCGIETMVNGSAVIVSGEVKSRAKVDVEGAVMGALQTLGYNDSKCGISLETLTICNYLHEQSPDIDLGVSGGSEGVKEDIGAGDQGIVVGYATENTKSELPYATELAQSLQWAMCEYQKKNRDKFYPDSKCQVTIDSENASVVAVVLSASHAESLTHTQVQQTLLADVIQPWAVSNEINLAGVKIFINHTGKFTVCGPNGDSGVTGRKIVVDAYGPNVPVGGGAYSGKDGSKVDRSGAYMARYVARHLAKAFTVVLGEPASVQVQVSYCIGYSDPIAILIRVNDSDTVRNPAISELVKYLKQSKLFSPKTIIQMFDLGHFDFTHTTDFGHYKKGAHLPWEADDPSLVDKFVSILRGQLVLEESK